MHPSLTLTFTGRGRMRVRLADGRKLLDAVDFSFDSDLDTLLIGAIDKILKRNRIPLLSVMRVSVGGEVDRTSLAWRVAQTCAAAVRKAA